MNLLKCNKTKTAAVDGGQACGLLEFGECLDLDQIDFSTDHSLACLDVFHQLHQSFILIAVVFITAIYINSASINTFRHRERTIDIITCLLGFASDPAEVSVKGQEGLKD